MARQVLILFVAPLLCVACADGRDGELVVAFEPGALTGPTADPGTPMTDDTGYARLDWFPAFLVVSVDADDLEAPIVDTWPSLIPEQDPEVVTLEVDVPAGSARRLNVEVLIASDDGDTATYVDPPPDGSQQAFDIVAGQTTEVEVELTELEYGTVTAIIDSGANVEGIAWVDDDAGAVLPARALTDGSVETELAIGRTYWPRVVESDGNFVDFPLRTKTLTTEEPSQEITLELGQ